MQEGLASGWASHAMVLLAAALAGPFPQGVSLGSLELALPMLFLVCCQVGVADGVEQFWWGGR